VDFGLACLVLCRNTGSLFLHRGQAGRSGAWLYAGEWQTATVGAAQAASALGPCARQQARTSEGRRPGRPRQAAPCPIGARPEARFPGAHLLRRGQPGVQRTGSQQRSSKPPRGRRPWPGQGRRTTAGRLRQAASDSSTRGFGASRPATKTSKLE